MATAELPLVIFTILAQMSVGCFVVLGAVHVAAALRAGGWRRAEAAVDRLSDPALYAIGPVMVAALVASLFHLGNPVNALYTIGNLGSSWLSREIFLGSAFTCLGAAFAVTQWRRWSTPALRALLAGVTAVVGLGLVYAMSMVYLLPTVPGWDSWATPVSFFATTFLLGIFAVGAAFVAVTVVRRRRADGVADLTNDPDVAVLRRSLRGIAVAAIALLGVEFVVLPTYALGLAAAADGGATSQAADALLAGGGAVLAVRLALVFLGAGLLGVFLYRFAVAGRERLMVYAAAGAFALVLASEVIGRVLFYDSFARIGL